MRSTVGWRRSWCWIAGAVLLLVGCTDTKTVFVERPFFDDPPGAAGGFLGYGTEDARLAKLPVCGNCHVGQQASWETTHHADAWETLEASGHSRETCEGCHTVSQRGNLSSGSVGWEATGDMRFFDVQCESCHGPGQTHVSNPDASQPLAQLGVGTDLDAGCGECHSGTHHGFVDEWAQSPHAQVVAAAADNQACGACHRAQSTLEAWGETADYLDKDGPALPVVCAVCHDPHGSPNEHQLRFPVNTTSIEEHLCARCHNRRTVPDPNSSHGLSPHSPEAALLVGDAGWFPPNSNIDQGEIAGTHGSAANPKLCATCHLPSFDVTDEETGAFVFSVKGHLFRPIPCLDAQGVPLPFENGCEISTAARSFVSCTGAGCHGSEQAAFSAITAASTRIQKAVDDLRAQLLKVDPNLDGAGGPIDGANPVFTVAEGAFFNLELAEFGNQDFGTNTVLGSTVHNPFLVEALLLASSQAVEDEYGVAPSISPVELQRRLSEIKASAIH